MLIDSHSHLNMYGYRRFGVNIKDVLGQIRRDRILTVTNSMDLASYRVNRRIAEMETFVIPAFGIHPWNSHRYPNKIEVLEDLIDANDIIGEIGLDHYWVNDRARYKAQRSIFELFLSKTPNKPISVHTKGAERNCLDLISEYGNEKVMIHWYSGDLEILDEMIDADFHFTVGPEIEISDHIMEIAERIPVNRILTETDNPGGSEWLFNEIGKPKLIKDVLQAVSEAKKRGVSEMERIVEENSLRFFGMGRNGFESDLLSSDLG